MKAFPWFWRFNIVIGYLHSTIASASELNDGPKVDKDRAGTIIGIDLGTSYSCAGVYKVDKDEVEIIPNEHGNRITPNYVAVSSEQGNTKFLVGDSAKEQALLFPKNTIFDVKRFIGRKYTDKSIKEEVELMPDKIKNRNGFPFISFDDNEYSPEQILGMVLSKLKLDAERYLGEEINKAVVTMPPYDDDKQRQSINDAINDAGLIAGLHIEHIFSEPVAAAIAHSFDRLGGEHNVLVYHLGGGTLNVSVLIIEDGVFETLATSGDAHLGGRDFDNATMNYFIELIKKMHKKDILEDRHVLQKLRNEVERAKVTLSSQLIHDLVPGFDFKESLTRDKFEQINAKLFQQTLRHIAHVLEEADLELSGEIDNIVMVGGSTRIPKIQQLVSEYFKGKELDQTINPDESIATGAAIMGGIISSRGMKGLSSIHYYTPISLGIDAGEGLMTKVVHRGTQCPTRKYIKLHTTEDNQRNMAVGIFQGERLLSKGNHLLGSIVLDLPPAPRGEIEVEVTFEVEYGGELEVTAEILATKRQKCVKFSPPWDGLDEEVIDAIIMEAEKLAEEDENVAVMIDARFALESHMN